MRVNFTYNSSGIFLEPTSARGKDLLKKLSTCFRDCKYVQDKKEHLFIVYLKPSSKSLKRK